MNKPFVAEWLTAGSALFAAVFLIFLGYQAWFYVKREHAAFSTLRIQFTLALACICIGIVCVDAYRWYLWGFIDAGIPISDARPFAWIPVLGTGFKFAGMMVAFRAASYWHAWDWWRWAAERCGTPLCDRVLKAHNGEWLWVTCVAAVVAVVVIAD